MIIKAAKRIFNSDKICRSYCDFYIGVIFLKHTVDASVVHLMQVHVPCDYVVVATCGQVFVNLSRSRGPRRCHS